MGAAEKGLDMASSKVSVLIPRTAGTNCDRELAWAFEQAGAAVSTVHINRLMDNPGELDHHQILALAGGFSYGDDIASGKIFANQLIHHLKRPLEQWVADGKLIIGICNGFQILVKAGLLPGPMPQLPSGDLFTGTLTHNSHARFEDRWVRLQSYSGVCKWIAPGKTVRLPIAHGEGRFMVRSAGILDALKHNDQIVLRYVDTAGNPAAQFPENPNGSTDAIAGICDVTGRVFGLMPHPERFTETYLGPDWTRNRSESTEDGSELFANAVHFVRQSGTVLVASNDAAATAAAAG